MEWAGGRGRRVSRSGRGWGRVRGWMQSRRPGRPGTKGRKRRLRESPRVLYEGLAPSLFTASTRVPRVWSLKSLSKDLWIS